MDSATRCPMRREYLTCKPTFKGNLSKLIKTEVKLRACAQITSVYVTERTFSLPWQTEPILPNLIKIGQEMAALSWTKA